MNPPQMVDAKDEKLGQVALVTGSSRGIGAAVARALGVRGYAVCVNYQANGDAASAVVADIEGRGGRAIAVPADVSDAEDVRRLFGEVDDQLGPVTALVNNAAIVGPRCRLDEVATDDLDRILAVNVRGTVLCAQQAIWRMSRRHGGAGGSIINISSGTARTGAPGRSVHYALSKAAIDTFGIGLAQEVAGEGIRVNTVTPGITRTDMPGQDSIDNAASMIPIGRVGEPEDVAAAVTWLLSDDASFIAGATIRVSGGRP